jgi:hypothetical protein
LYNFKSIGIDAGSGSLGVGIYDQLMDNDATKRKVVAIDNKARFMDRDKTKKKTLVKEDLYDNLRAMMEQGRIQLLNDEYLIECLRGIQYEYVMKSGSPSRMVIYGVPHVLSDAIESLNRAAIFSQDKALNISLYSIKV